MENHLLTPMRDANLVRVLSRRTKGTVRLVPYVVVEQGGAAIRGAITALAEQGWRYAIVDAVNDVHRVAVGEAAAAHALITGGSSVAMGLPANFWRAGLLPEQADPGALPTLASAAAVLAGSCLHVALGQLDFARARVGVLSRPTCGPLHGCTCGRRDRLGVPAAWSNTNCDCRFGTALKGCDGAAATRPGFGCRTDRWRALPRARCCAMCGALPWPAAKPRRPRCHDSASAVCGSAARSILVYPGPMPRAANRPCCSHTSRVISVGMTSS
jgi:hypothetical protein